MRKHHRPAASEGFGAVEFAIMIAILGIVFLMALKGAVLIPTMRSFVTARQINNFQSAVLHYQSDFRALPGDDIRAAERWGRPEALFNIGATATVSFAGDGRINGLLSDPGNANGEQYMSWRDLRAAGYIGGDASLVGQSAQPETPSGGVYGFSENNLGIDQALCLTKVPGRDAELLDKRLDDGNIATGRLRGTSRWDPVGAHNQFPEPDSAPYNPDKTYIICMPDLP